MRVLFPPPPPPPSPYADPPLQCSLPHFSGCSGVPIVKSFRLNDVRILNTFPPSFLPPSLLPSLPPSWISLVVRQDAVDTALKAGVTILAKTLALRPVHDEALRRRLWLRIAERVVRSH
eukprot:GHVU01181315.1.p4 GENE.GHVU01181315.1~~GHVU01181315.1.p4  ORF type:complete len:119 (-),score=20.14 GHVU01181315.1:594-950(-)